MKYRFCQFALIGAAMCVAATAQAQTTAPPPSMRVACGPDMQKFCPGLKGKEVRMCLRAFHAQISPDCLASLDQAKAKRTGGAMAAPPPAAGAPPAGKDE